MDLTNVGRTSDEDTESRREFLQYYSTIGLFQYICCGLLRTLPAEPKNRWYVRAFEDLFDDFLNIHAVGKEEYLRPGEVSGTRS